MKWQPKHSSLLVIAIGFGLLYFNFHKLWLLVPVGISLVGFFINPMGEFVHKSWMMLAKILGYINSRIILSLLFFVVLTPLGIAVRLLKKSEFSLSPKKRNTFFITRNHLYTKKDLLQPW